MPLKSLRSRILIFFIGLLVVVQSLAFLLISQSNEQIIRTQISDELQLGEKVFKRQQEQAQRQLLQASKVLSGDFAFRTAIATRDTDTIASVLENHGQRIQAQLVMLANLDGVLVGNTLHPEQVGQPYPFPQPWRSAQQHGSFSGIHLVEGKLYQLVVVPIKAPLPIAWVTMGFAISNTDASELAGLTLSQISFISHTPNGWTAHASTLPAAQLNEVLQQLPPRGAPNAGAMPVDNDTLQTRVLALGADGGLEVYALLQRSLQQAMAPARLSQLRLLLLAAASLLLSLLGGWLIARGISRPVAQLADAARKMRDGDYSQPIQIQDRSEIGELGQSLDYMRNAVSEREKRILQLAYEDPLTGLPNRSLFNDRLAQAIRAARRNDQTLAVVMLDLDRFKLINDTLGHQLGDMVLCEVGQRLQKAVRSSDTVARFSGDEFALLLLNVSADDALPLLRKIQQGLEQQTQVEGQLLDIGGSFGIAGYPQHAEDGGSLIRLADVAMNAAKTSKAGVIIYQARLENTQHGQLSLLGDLRRAVDEQQLTLFVQPKLDLRNGGLQQAEVLVRWIHPQRGLIPPNDFIPFAEHTGYIRHITQWVLSAATQLAGQWLRQGLAMQLSVNVSTTDLLNPELVESLRQAIAAAGIPPAQLCLEITESGFMSDPDYALKVLHQLHDMGLKLSIDDFGTGYSSLAYLKKLPVSELKIDRAFVMHMLDDADDAVIVRSTIDLGHNLGLSVVAEGVENADMLQMLQQLGCDQAQGYHLSKPMPAADFPAWLQTQTTP